MSLLVSGGFNQADERFTDDSRGKQCTFMTLSALLTAQIIPVDQWNSTTVDSALMQGNEMYLNALYNCHIPREQLLLVDHLPRVVSNFSFKQKTDLSVVAEPIEAQNCTNTWPKLYLFHWNHLNGICKVDGIY